MTDATSDSELGHGQMKTTKQTLNFLLKKLPMPKDCVLFGEASFYDETASGVAVRRNLRLDVSKRIPKGTAPYPKAKVCSEDEVFYLELVESLVDEVANGISSGLGIVWKDWRLGNERGDYDRVCFSVSNFVTVRARFSHLDGKKTFWKIDFVAVVQTAR